MRPLLPVLFACTCACGGAEPRPVSAGAPRALDEARFLEIAVQVLGEYNAGAEQNRPIQAIGIDGTFDTDVGVVGKNVAVEFVSDADRVRLGNALPSRSQSGALRVLGATNPSTAAPVDVLILEDNEYRYDPNPVESGGRGPTVQEVEGRLQRDLRDFFQNERQAGNL